MTKVFQRRSGEERKAQRQPLAGAPPPVLRRRKLIQVIHKIGVRAAKRVEKELLDDFKRVTGKITVLFHIAEASVHKPDGCVRDVVFPAAGGEPKLRDLVREYKSSGPSFRFQVHTYLRASYAAHYRRMVPSCCKRWLSAFGDPDDRLARGAPVGGERSRRFGERPYRPDDRLEPSVPEPLGEVREPETVGFNDKEDRAPVLGLDRGHPCDGDERAAGAHQCSGAVENLAAYHVEHHVKLASVFQLVGLQVQEGMHPQTEGGVAVRGPAGADHEAPTSRASCTAIEPTPPTAP